MGGRILSLLGYGSFAKYGKCSDLCFKDILNEGGKKKWKKY